MSTTSYLAALPTRRFTLRHITIPLVLTLAVLCGYDVLIGIPTPDPATPIH